MERQEEHGRTEDVGQEEREKRWTDRTREEDRQEDRGRCVCLTCSSVDWEKLYSSKLKVCLAEDEEKEKEIN